MLVRRHFLLGFRHLNISIPHKSTTLGYFLNNSHLFCFHANISCKCTMSLLGGQDLILPPPRAFPDLTCHSHICSWSFVHVPGGLVSWACFFTGLLAFRRKTLFLTISDVPGVWSTVFGPRKSFICAWTEVRDICDFLHHVVNAFSVPSINEDWFGISGVVCGPYETQSGETLG